MVGGGDGEGTGGLIVFRLMNGRMVWYVDRQMRSLLWVEIE